LLILETMKMPQPLIAPRLLFHVAVPLLHHEPLWSTKGVTLDEQYTLLPLAMLDGESIAADVRAAWSEAGLAITVRVEGKRQTPWCRASRIEESDGIQVWIDTRDTHNIHRASRFCHRFGFMPTGGGARRDQPMARQLEIPRAKEDMQLAPEDALQVRSEKRIDGYLLQAMISAEALTGFDPAEHPQLGFNYAVMDREQGLQIWSANEEYPYDNDPSLWGTLDLVKN
jgi:hypothetical protein